MTQEQLADASGVSVRTVRGLETGKIGGPHRATLVALADALFTEPERRDELIRAWTTGQGGPSLAEVFEAEGNFAEQLAELRARNQTDLHILSLTKHARVADRIIVEATTAVVARALHDGVDRRLMVTNYQPPPRLDLSKVVVDQLRNCTQLDRIEREEDGMLAIEFGFGRPLRAGQTHSYSYRTTLPPVDVGDELLPTGKMNQGFDRLVSQLLLEVSFEGKPPARIWETDSADRDVVRPLESDVFGSVHVLKHNAEPGIVGIAWDWDA